MSGPWRDKADDTRDRDIYPGLTVWDARCAGSITLNNSRLPLWAISGTAICLGWDEVEKGWKPGEHYGYTVDDFAEFVYHLLNLRGEFGRLVAMLANAERVHDEADDAYYDGLGGGVIELTDEVLDGQPAPWWETPSITVPLVAQLQRCIASLSPPTQETP